MNIFPSKLVDSLVHWQGGSSGHPGGMIVQDREGCDHRPSQSPSITRNILIGVAGYPEDHPNAAEYVTVNPQYPGVRRSA